MSLPKKTDLQASKKPILVRMTTFSVLPIEGKIQHYAWGGNLFIPQLLNIDNVEKRPFAELWMGTHPRGTATIHLPEATASLLDFIQQHPEVLGTRVENQFQGKLPFLFKILDVKQMLSIQSHPTIEQARHGFAKEN